MEANGLAAVDLNLAFEEACRMARDEVAESSSVQGKGADGFGMRDERPQHPSTQHLMETKESENVAMPSVDDGLDLT